MRPRTPIRTIQLLLSLTLVLSAAPAVAAFRSETLLQLDAAITNAIAESKCPGAVVWVERNGEIYQEAYGQRSVKPVSEPMTLDTVFDIASLTKVVATAPAVALLIERGQVRLDDGVRKYLPEFNGKGTDAITVRHLLTHTSGLLTGISGAQFTNYQGGITRALQEIPRVTPGTEFTYSDLNFVLLAEIVRRVARQPLNEFVAEALFRPLRMSDTGFLPPASLQARVAPTQELPEGVLRGQVHDPTARRMEGVTGSAGVFSTAADLARFARMMLNAGELNGVRVCKPETIHLMISVQSPAKVTARRGLGWDIDSGFSRPRGLVFPLGSYGHTGFTGVFLWIDPYSKTIVILLTNRLHPTGQGNVTELYGVVSTLAARAVEDFDFNKVPGAMSFRTNFISNWGAATNFIGSSRDERGPSRPP